ncbi:MAG: hypothetical protein Fur0032_05160 [Terrimicrobiaceae bacterium]
MKKLIPVVIVAAILAMAAFWVMSRKQTPSGGKSGQRVLEGFRPELVGGIVIEGPEGSVTLKDQGGRWGVVERSDYPANTEQIRAMVLEAWNMKAIQQIQLGEGSLARLQLVPPGGNPPAAVQETATRLQFLGADGKELASVLLGLPRVSDPADGMPGRPIGRYVMVPGQATAGLVSETFSMASPAPAPWLDKTFVKIENPVRIERKGPGGWVVKRENEGWVPEGTNQGTFQPGLVSSAVSLWRSPVFDDLGRSEDFPDGATDDEIVITVEGGRVYKIRRGPVQGTRTPLRISVQEVAEQDNQGDGAAPSAVAGDEKKESGESPDKAGKEEGPVDRLVEGQVYLLPTTTVDALFINRADLFVVPAPDSKGENQSRPPN